MCNLASGLSETLIHQTSHRLDFERHALESWASYADPETADALLKAAAEIGRCLEALGGIDTHHDHHDVTVQLV